jgi:MFS family permease
MLIVGRFIAGLSIGVLSMIVPVYQAEISPPVSLFDVLSEASAHS